MSEAKSPFAERWYQWLESSEGQKCANGQATGKYLVNRLHGAFSAAWNTAEAHFSRPAPAPPECPADEFGSPETIARNLLVALTRGESRTFVVNGVVLKSEHLKALASAVLAPLAAERLALPASTWVATAERLPTWDDRPKHIEDEADMVDVWVTVRLPFGSEMVSHGYFDLSENRWLTHAAVPILKDCEVVAWMLNPEPRPYIPSEDK